MPLTPDAPAADAPARPPLSVLSEADEEATETETGLPAPLDTSGIEPADIDPAEMDEMVMRIFRELTRQIDALENTEVKNIEEASVRERDARILASLERTMERLAQIEAGRAAARRSAKEADNGLSVRKALDARIDRIIAIEFQKAARSKAER